MKKRIILPAAGAAAVMAAIFLFSSRDVGVSLGQSGRVTRALCRVIFFRFGKLTGEQQEFIVTELDFFVRKAAHFCVYTLLGAMTYCVMLCIDRISRKGGAALAVCAVYAALDEMHQYIVPGRTMRLSDVGIDSAGALLGILTVWVIVRLISPGGKSPDDG
ncbi:MAG: VanZ family protein [Ruminococcus sp.]|nr:VanZ family protein [Ruminococcus sp.]